MSFNLTFYYNAIILITSLICTFAAILSIPLHKAWRFNDTDITSFKVKEKATPFPAHPTFKQNKKHI